LGQAGTVAYFLAAGVLVAKFLAARAPCVKVTTKKKKYSHKIRKPIFQPLKHFEVSLDGLEIKMALILGDGDLTLGIRRAVVFASMRQDHCPCS
jgi:hypothetical protein